MLSYQSGIRNPKSMIPIESRGRNFEVKEKPGTHFPQVSLGSPRFSGFRPRFWHFLFIRNPGKSTSISNEHSLLYTHTPQVRVNFTMTSHAVFSHTRILLSWFSWILRLRDGFMRCKWFKILGRCEPWKELSIHFYLKELDFQLTKEESLKVIKIKRLKQRKIYSEAPFSWSF